MILKVFLQSSSVLGIVSYLCLCSRKFNQEVTYLTPSHTVLARASPVALPEWRDLGNVGKQSVSAIDSNSGTKLESWQAWEKDNLYIDIFMYLFIVQVFFYCNFFLKTGSH